MVGRDSDEPNADYPTVAQFALSTLKTLHLYLSPAEQSHLYSTSSRALDTARRRGDDRLVEYWAGKPVLSLEVAPYVSERLLSGYETYLYLGLVQTVVPSLAY